LVDQPSVSLRRRLIVWLTGATLLIGGLALIDTRAEAIRTARDISDRVLAGSAMAIAERASIGSSGEVEVAIPFSALDMLSSIAQDRVFYRVDGPEGFLTGYQDLSPVATAIDQRAGFADDDYRGTAIRKATVLRELTNDQGVVPIQVTVAESTRARATLASSILARSALRIAVLITVAVAVAWVAATIALRPLSRLSAALSARAPHDLTPVDADALDELRPVLAALNGFLARLQQSTAALQNFAGNANHQIRTPLAVARTQIALAQPQGSRQGANSELGKADQALVRAERVLAQLLLLAKVQATGQNPPLVPTDVASLGRAVVEEALPEALRHHKDLGFEGPAAATAATDEILLAELLRNLVSNAILHAPAGTVVTLQVVQTNDRVMMTVTDNGPELDASALGRLEHLLRRGTEGGLVRATQHGLGLPIVAEIARALRIDIEVGAGHGGAGIAFKMALPPLS
jgi:two-component system sensor histidine kinase TctE